MKKHYAAIAVMALSLGVTACSSKSDKATTAAPAQATTTAADQTTESAQAASQSEEELEENYYYGYVNEVKDKVITVVNDEGKTASFDVTGAELSGSGAIGSGDEVEVTFTGELSADVTKAAAVDIITSQSEQSQAEAAAEDDLTVSGTIEKADDKTVTLKTADGTYTFNALITQKVTKGGIKAGVGADVTYYGDLEDQEDKPVATKIVTADAKDTPDAKIKTLTGKVAEVKSDHVVLDTIDPDNTLFAFQGSAGMFDRLKVGDTATVIYKGTLTDRTITAAGLK